MWLGSTRPRSQCVGGMLLVQWCYKHVLNCINALELARGQWARRRPVVVGHLPPNPNPKNLPKQPASCPKS